MTIESHRALSIGEILITLFDYLDLNKGTLASCAQCNQLFSRFALDSLWRSLETTLPLDRLLPEDAEENDPTSNVSK